MSTEEFVYLAQMALTLRDGVTETGVPSAEEQQTKSADSRTRAGAVRAFVGCLGFGLLGGVDFLLLDLAELLDAADVTAVAESGGEEDLDDVADLVFAEQVGAEAQDVAVVVLAGAAGGDLVVNECGADATDLVGRDGHADAAAVHEDARLAGPGGNRAGGGGGEVGVVAGPRPVAAEIGNVVPLLLEDGQQPPLRFVPTMIARDRKLHS